MRLLALLLVPAFIGFVRSQGGQDVNFPDTGRGYGGSSASKRLDPFPNANGNQGFGHQGFGHQGFGQNVQHTNLGNAPARTSSGQIIPDYAPVGQQPISGNGNGHQGFGHQGFPQNNVQHPNLGNAPARTNSGQIIPDYAPVGQQPISGNVNHMNVGNTPLDTGKTGGSSGQLADIPGGPVQTGMVDNVNMVNAGAAPVAGQGNSPNSGEYQYDYGAAAGAANNAPAAAGGTGNGQVYNGPGGFSNNGNGGPAVAVGPFSDHAGAAAPLGGAGINDLMQQEAGKAGHVSGAASATSTIAGVVIAVLVLVGIVAVAAVFLVRQRQSRMTIASV